MDTRCARNRPGHRRVLAGDRGSATVEFAVLLPLFLLLFLAAVQGGMWWYARNLCLSAAQHGVQAGRTTTATTTDAHTAAESFLARAGSDVVTDTAVSTTGTTTTTVRVQVSATALRVLPIPGLDLRITQSVEGSKERFTTDDRGFAGAGP